MCAEPTVLKRYLGEGQDGAVFETTRYTAIKACNSPRVYHNEKEAYLHLLDRGCVEKIGEFHIPSIKGWDDDLLVVEMDYMTRPPYIIDFGKSKLFSDPEFSEQTSLDNEDRGLELFEHNWPRVKVLLADLESFLLYYLDPKPGNIVFEDTFDHFHK